MLLSLAQAGRRYGGGEPLPVVLPSLERADIRLRRGQVTMFAGQPGSGKTMLVQWLVDQLASRGVISLYLSADTDPETMRTRAAARATGETIRSVELAMASDNSGYYEDALAGIDHVEYSFDSAPSCDDIELEVKAFEEKWGRTPDVLIVDNLMNVDAQHDNEWLGMREISKVLHWIARKTGAAVFVLHHTSEDQRDPTVPPPRRTIQGKVSQLPELIITQAMADGTMRLAAVKNRNGRADPLGGYGVSIRALPERAAFSDFGGLQIPSPSYVDDEEDI